MRHAAPKWWGFGPAVLSWDYQCFDVVVMDKLFRPLEGPSRCSNTCLGCLPFQSTPELGTVFSTRNVTLSGCFYETKGAELCIVLCVEGWGCILVLVFVAMGVSYPKVWGLVEEAGC